MRRMFFFLGCMIFVCVLGLSGCANRDSQIIKGTSIFADESVLKDVIVDVNGEFVLKSEIDPVYKQYSNTEVSYEKIVDDTIKEILVIQQSAKYNILISDKEVEQLLTDFEKEHPKLYMESMELYGEEKLKRKLKDNFLYDQTKTYVKKHILTIDDSVVNSFKSQQEFNGYLDKMSNEDLLISLGNEITEYAFYQWVEVLRTNAKITYYSNLQ